MQLQFNFVEFEQVEDTELSVAPNFVEAQGVVDMPVNFQFNFNQFEEVYDRPLNFQCTFIEVQSIVSVMDNPWNNIDEDSPMSTAKFPELKGLTWDIKRRPIFSTAIATAIGGRETRTSFWENPKWEWELNYEYLPNYNQNNSDLDAILGFFIARHGAFQSFLYKFQEDYHIEDQILGVADGVASDFTFVRSIGPATTPVDYVDFDDNPPLVWLRTQFAAVATGTHIQGHANIVEITEVKNQAGDILTRVDSAPASNQYSVNLGSGQFTFNALTNGQTVTVKYKYLLQSSEYQLIVANGLVINETPTVGTLVYSTFDYFWNVRFKEDQAEFNLFVEKLWELQEVTLLSVPV